MSTIRISFRHVFVQDLTQQLSYAMMSRHGTTSFGKFLSSSRSLLSTGSWKKRCSTSSFPSQSSHGQKLSQLRALMKLNHLDAYLVPMSDPHLSEYLSDCYTRLKYLSQFTGSAGTVVITVSNALLWTDGRYQWALRVRSIHVAD